jgi:hypothetical protein
MLFFITIAPIVPTAPAAKAIPPKKRFVFFRISNLKSRRPAWARNTQKGIRGLKLENLIARRVPRGN